MSKTNGIDANQLLKDSQDQLRIIEERLAGVDPDRIEDVHPGAIRLLELATQLATAKVLLSIGESLRMIEISKSLESE